MWRWGFGVVVGGVQGSSARGVVSEEVAVSQRVGRGCVFEVRFFFFANFRSAFSRVERQSKNRAATAKSFGVFVTVSSERRVGKNCGLSEGLCVWNVAV